MDLDLRFSRFEILTGAGAAILCLFFISVFTEASAIENEVSTGVAEAVSSSDDLYWSSVEAKGQAVVLTGAAPDVPAQQAAMRRAEEVWGVSNVENNIEVIGSSGNCQGKFDDYLQKAPIKFQSGKAEIAQSSYNTISMLAMLVRKCTSRIEVAGHTDGKGDAKVNLKLSQRRADTVAKYLVNHGVSPDKITPRGYGETQPLSDNETQEGRSQNRRIEFRVLGEAA